MIVRNLSNILSNTIRHCNFQFRNMAYTVVEKGTLYSNDYRVYLKNSAGRYVSPFHDVPLYADPENTICNMVVEIPRWTNAKMEINLKEVLNPIKQDIKKEKPRFVPNVFPHKGYIWNYGALPQTWEDPNVTDEHTKYKGDNDPIDCIEIGSRVAKRGEVITVKILGTLALIDEGETDWKIISINTNDPLAREINSIADVDKVMPGLMKATVEWFRIYKIPDGKPENKFAFNGEAKPADFAAKIIEEVHEHWKKLISRQTDGKGISIATTTLTDIGLPLPLGDAENIISKFPDVNKSVILDDSVDKWHYVKLPSV